MMNYRLTAIGIFFADQLLKYIARVRPDFSFYLWKPWLGWEYFANTGIAFSVPFPQTLILLGTPVLLLAFLLLARKRPAAWLIIFGALSNYLDRLFFGHTIDYIRIATGVFNIADFLILAGLLSLMLSYRSPVVTDEPYVRKDSVGGDLGH